MLDAGRNDSHQVEGFLVHLFFLTIVLTVRVLLQLVTGGRLEVLKF
jgi:hypothetical protein